MYLLMLTEDMGEFETKDERNNLWRKEPDIKNFIHHSHWKHIIKDVVEKLMLAFHHVICCAPGWSIFLELTLENHYRKED
jgi:hypothetical protein